MTSHLAAWLASIGWTAFVWALGGLLVVNGAALAAWVWKRDRALVQLWVAPWLAANLLLVLLGVGVPAATSAVRLVLMAVEGSPPISLLNSASRLMGRPANPGVRQAD
jgi:hypothetical protein